MEKNLRATFLVGNSFALNCATALFSILLICATVMPGESLANPTSLEDSGDADITVTGKVSSAEDDTGLPGVNIIVKGTSVGTVTDSEGNYSITADENGVLVFSYVGYVTQEVSIEGRGRIEVTLAMDNTQLSELIIIGYGSREKKDLTGSVARVGSTELAAIPVYSVEQALNGRAAGVTVQQNSGEPGGRMEVRIRGGNSMIGSNDPLYVIDGFAMTGSIDFLNPADIESIDILKDASATAIYGSRGANGVVIITTKKGKKGTRGKIEVSSFYGIQEEINRYKLLNAKQYAEVVNEWAKNEGLQPYFDLDTVSNPGLDWQDKIFRAAPIQSHTVTFSGASDATRYSFSTNFYQQDGIIINTGVKRGSMRFNLDHNVNKIVSVGFNVTLSRREENRLDVNNGNYGGRIYTDALSAPPTLKSPFDSNGNYLQIEQLPEYPYVNLDVRNPLIHREKKDRALVNGVLANAFVEFNIMEGLKFRSMFGLEYSNTINETFVPIIFSTDLGSASDGYAYRNSFLNENIVTYTKSLGADHELGFVGGFTSQNYMSRFASASVRGISNNITENYDLAAASVINAPGNGISEWTLLSWLGRVNYSYKDKYLATASIRSDGSSRFGENNRWATFPSVALAWRVSKEAFMSSIEFVDDLKLRVTYGVTGNTALSPYQSLDRLGSVRVVQGNNTDEVGYIQSSLANTDLQWETTKQLDIGFDLAVLDGRVEFTFDYYKKNTDALLAAVPLPPSVGFSSALKNIGEVQNSGVEIGINSTIISKGKLRWDAFGQISFNKNEVVELAGGADIFGSTNSHPFNATINIAREGQPLGVFYGLIEDGLDPATGYVKYVDQDNNGIINTLDRVILGSPYPDFSYGLNSTVSYGNFSLNLYLQGIQGRDVFWETAGIHLNSFQRGNNQIADLYGNYWTSDDPNPDAKYPKVSSTTSQLVSDRYVKDGSYMRLKLVKLGYNIPVSKWNWINSAQVYISGTNLLTFTNYPGLDPEVNVQGTDSQSIGSRLRVGLDDSAYPSAKIVSFGIDLGF